MKTQADLLEELRFLRRRVAELELAATCNEVAGDAPTPVPADDDTQGPGPKAPSADALALDERQRAYARLFKQTKLLQSMLDDVGDGIVVCDQQGRFLQFNPAAIEILGRGAYNTSPENWSSIYGLFLPDQVTPFPADELPLTRSLRGEEIDGLEMFVRNEGRPQGLWISVTTRPLRDDSASIRGAIAVLRDITEAKASRAALVAQQQFLQHLLDAHERERTLTAYEIHDGLVQDMTGALLHLDPAGRAIPPSEVNAHKSLATARKSLEQGIGEARRVISGLRPPVLDREGILPAIEMLAAQKSRPDREIKFEHGPLKDRLPTIVEGNLYRIVQECLNNVARHSQARRVRIKLSMRDARLRLVIRDDGVGFNPEAVPRDRYGLLGIRERAQLLGGRCTVVSQVGQGSQITVEIPLSAAGPGKAAVKPPEAST